MRVMTRHWGWVGLVLLANLDGGLTRAADGPPQPPQQPYLRIETGEHTAAIRRLAATADGQLAATVADDKTIRLWRLPTGEAAGVLRVPIADEAEGKLYALAIAPDGSSLVAAGHTGITWDGAVALYLFDLNTGRLRGRLARQPHFINDLAFSPDGRFVAAVFGGQEGLRVWESQQFKPVAIDTDYQGRGAWVSFAPDGRLATAAFDGLIRLYSADFRLLAKQPAPGGKTPYSLAFSPDGERLAVGQYEGAKVDILSGRTLEPLYAAATADLAKGANLAAVAWSQAGAELVLWAGGSAFQPDGRRFIRRWGEAGRAPARDIPVARTNLNALRDIPGVGLAFVSSDPSWGWLAPDGQLRNPLHRANIADFRGLYAGRFGLSSDGALVDVGLAFGGAQPVRFDVNRRALTTNPPEDGRTQPPRLAVGKEKVTDWQDKNTPRFGKVALKLVEGDIAHSAALSAEGNTLVLGAEYRLYLFRQGNAAPVQQRHTPAAVWGVNVSENGQVAVAALADGTLRWYSLRPGQELELLGSLFLVPGSDTWIAWTPEGFFAPSSAGGQELVGFHLNRGPAASPLFADFSQIYNRLNRDALVSAKLLGTAGPEFANAAANAAEFVATLRQQPLPRSRWLEYCAESEPSRGFARVEVLPAAPTPTVAATPSASPVVPPISVTASPPPVAARCSPLAGATRGFARLPAEAPPSQEANNPIKTELQRVRVRFEVTDEGGGLGIVDLFQNGRLVKRFLPDDPALSPADATRGFARVAAPSAPVASDAPDNKPKRTLEQVLLLQSGQNDLEIRAYNRLRAFSRSPLLTLVREATSAATRAAPSKKRLFLVAVGINKYPSQELSYAVSDAREVTRALQQTARGLFDEVRLIERYDQAANRAGLSQLFGELVQQTQPADTLVLYIAGHGMLDKDGRFFFISQDTTITQDNIIVIHQGNQKAVVINPANPPKGALEQDAMVQAVGEIQRQGVNIFFILDTCHAGAFDPSLAGRIAGEAQNYIGLITLAGAAGYQEADDNYRQSGHGLLAYTLLSGLQNSWPTPLPKSKPIGVELLASMVDSMAKYDAMLSGTKKSVDYKRGSDAHFKDFPIAQLPATP